MSADRPPSPPEGRLRELLGLIQQAPPEPPVDVTRRVLATARWERGVRSTTHVLGGFGSTLAEGLAILLGVRRARR